MQPELMRGQLMRTALLFGRSAFALGAALVALLVATASPSDAQSPIPISVPIDTAFKLWQRGPEVKALRSLLARQGLLDAAKTDDPRFDLDVMAAVRAFQHRIGVKPTGIPRQETL